MTHGVVDHHCLNRSHIEPIPGKNRSVQSLAEEFIFASEKGGMTHNVHAFVLLGTSSIRRPRRRQPNVVTKDKILFCCPIVIVKLGQKLSSELTRPEKSLHVKQIILQ